MQTSPASEDPQAVFLDVPHLIDASHGAGRSPAGRWALLLIGVMIAFAITGANASETARAPLQVLTLLIVVAVLGGSAWVTTTAVRRQRTEQRALDDVEELIQLRQWESAARGVEALLNVPTRSPRVRLQGLLELSAVLSRYGRFEDAIAVQTHLLEAENLDDAAEYVIRVGRALAMLREDNLLDADRAISDIRKRSAGAMTGAAALVELYRDVKTGHPEEALQHMTERLPMIRQQMGHRVADAHALYARAQDMQGRDVEAAASFERATLLAPAGELLRRYPELRPLFDRYTPAPAPAEAA